MKIEENTSVVDVALNLSGSLTGLPAVVEQLPVGELVGFDTMPLPGEDVSDIGQTWTPDLQNKEVELAVPVYNPSAQEKAPYTTNMHDIATPVADGEEWIAALLSGATGRVKRVTDLKVGDNLRGCTIVFTMTHLVPKVKADANTYFGLITYRYKGHNYIGDILAHYGASAAASANSLIFYTNYNFNTNTADHEIVYSDARGWVAKSITFDSLADSFINSENTDQDTLEPGYWNWNYAYVIFPEFPNPKKKLSDIPVGYNLRGKTLYFHAPELPVSDGISTEPGDWALSAGDFSIYPRIKGSDNRYAISVIRFAADGSIAETFPIYDWYKGSFIATKFTFPDDRDLIVEESSLPTHPGEWLWGFDYAEVSDDSTLDIPIPNIVRPWMTYRNLKPCNLTNWVNSIAAAVKPTTTSQGAIQFTTDGVAEFYNGGGYFDGVVVGHANDRVSLKVQVRSAEARIFVLNARNAASSAGPTLRINYALANNSWFQASASAVSTIDIDRVLFAKEYASAQPAGTYEAQNFDIEIYKNY